MGRSFSLFREHIVNFSPGSQIQEMKQKQNKNKLKNKHLNGNIIYR